MKKLLLLAALCLPTQVFGQTVTVSFTVTNAEAVRVATDLGLLRGLKDGQGNNRPATLAEVKQSVIDQIRGIVQAAELPAAQQAAAAAVTITQVAPQ